jgi:hypothetical protein
MDASSVAQRFRTAVEARHVDGMLELLSPATVLNSPVTFKPYRGKEAVGLVLTAVSEVFEDFEYVDEVEGDGVHGLVFKARVGEREVQGIDLIRPDGTGKIAELTVMVRPMSGLLALAEAMKVKVEEKFAAAQGAGA